MSCMTFFCLEVSTFSECLLCTGHCAGQGDVSDKPTAYLCAGQESRVLFGKLNKLNLPLCAHPQREEVGGEELLKILFITRLLSHACGFLPREWGNQIQNLSCVQSQRQDLSSALSIHDPHNEGHPGTTWFHPEGLDIDLSHCRVLQEFNLGYILHITGPPCKRTEQVSLCSLRRPSLGALGPMSWPCCPTLDSSKGQKEVVVRFQDKRRQEWE